MFVLDRFWKEGLHPAEMPFERDENYYQAAETLSREEKAFFDSLSPAQRESFDRMFDSLVHMNALNEQSCFVRGFRLGALLVLDVLAGLPPYSPPGTK